MVVRDAAKRMTGLVSCLASGFCRPFRNVCGVLIVSLLGLPVLGFQARQAHDDASASGEATFAATSAKADAARDANRLEEAESLYKKALALRPDWSEGWWSLGTIEYDRSAYADAVYAFEKLTALVPKNGNAYVMFGLSEFELGRDVPALQHLEKGASLGLDQNINLRYVALYHVGIVRQRLGRFQAAQETLEQLCLQGVQSDALASTLGMVLLRMRSKEPPPPGSQDAEVVTRVGHAGCLAGQKKFDEAKKELTAVVGEHPEYPNIHYALGIVLLEASDLSGANAEFKEEIKNNPADIVSRLQIAAAMYKTDSAGGVPYAEEAVRLAPQQPFGHYLLGMLLLDVDDYQKAIPELEIAQKAFPRESKIYLAMGSAYSRAGRKQEAAQARATFTRMKEEDDKAGSGDPGSGTTGSGKIPVGEVPATPQ